MFDTLAVMAYLVGSHPEKDKSLKMVVAFPEKPALVSPMIRWKNMPPETDSIAVIIRDDQKHYYWVAYNLPPDATKLPYGASQLMIPHDEGINSFGQQGYHSPWASHYPHQTITIELFALNRRLSADRALSGDSLLTKVQSAEIASAKADLTIN